MPQAGFRMLAVSRIWQTPAFPAGSGPDFANAALVALWQGAGNAAAALAALHGIEARFGRDRANRWAPRTLDLDLLAFGDLVLPDAAGWQAWHDLPPDRQQYETPDCPVLPHPRMQERAFVLVPLAEVAPDWRHPMTGSTVLQMRDSLPAADLSEIRPLPTAS